MLDAGYSILNDHTPGILRVLDRFTCNRVLCERRLDRSLRGIPRIQNGCVFFFTQHPASSILHLFQLDPISPGV
jgi:hypothetical protein